MVFKKSDIILRQLLDGLDLKVKSNQREDKAFQILDQVVESSQTIWISEIYESE